MNKVKEVKEKKKRSLMRKEGVVGVAVGEKESEGKKTGEDSVIVLVRKKKPLKKIGLLDRVPKKVKGVPTDVVEVGDIVAQLDPKVRIRPLAGGISIGHYKITSGTLGIVCDYQGKKMILSNNHVLANSNDARVGDPIYQPGVYDGGTSSDKVGTLFKFVPINFSGSNPPPPPDDDDDDDGSSCPIARIFTRTVNFTARTIGSSYRVEYVKQASTNYVDAALALPDVDVVPDFIHNIGDITGVSTVYTPGMKVKKMGRTTGYTEGEIRYTDMTAKVNYGANKIAVFEDQLFLSPMSAGGDSGSVIVNEKNEIIALLFAGSEMVTIVTPIHLVMQYLGVNFM